MAATEGCLKSTADIAVHLNNIGVMLFNYNLIEDAVKTFNDATATMKLAIMNQSPHEAYKRLLFAQARLSNAQTTPSNLEKISTSNGQAQNQSKPAFSEPIQLRYYHPQPLHNGDNHIPEEVLVATVLFNLALAHHQHPNGVANALTIYELAVNSIGADVCHRAHHKDCFFACRLLQASIGNMAEICAQHGMLEEAKGCSEMLCGITLEMAELAAHAAVA